MLLDPPDIVLMLQVLILFKGFIDLYYWPIFCVMELTDHMSTSMITSRSIIVLILFFCYAGVKAQELNNWEDTARTTSEEIMMADEWTARAASLAKIPSVLTKALDHDGSFYTSFDSSRISITYAPDSTFRILTGQAVLEGDNIKYYGLLQLKTDERNPVLLHDYSHVPADIAKEVLSPNDWNGAVYYKMLKFRFAERDYYMAFGFSAKSFFENCKVAEVIYFEEDGAIKFGAPVFKDINGDYQSRLSLVYAADVGAKLNYDTSLAMIVFDNLIPMKSPYKERKVLMVPDGSYSGYTWNDDVGWVFVDKIFHETLDEAPREIPVLDQQKGKDITGRPIKSKNR